MNGRVGKVDKAHLAGLLRHVWVGIEPMIAIAVAAAVAVVTGMGDVSLAAWISRPRIVTVHGKPWRRVGGSEMFCALQ